MDPFFRANVIIPSNISMDIGDNQCYTLERKQNMEPNKDVLFVQLSPKHIGNSVKGSKVDTETSLYFLTLFLDSILGRVSSKSW